MRSIARTPMTPGIAILVVAMAGCGAHDDTKPTVSASTDQTAQQTTPPPPGDSTPKAADSQTATAQPNTDSTSRSSGAQSTVGSAAAGAPPYTLNGAPEGNKAPASGEPPKK